MQYPKVTIVDCKCRSIPEMDKTQDYEVSFYSFPTVADQLKRDTLKRLQDSPAVKKADLGSLR